MKVAIGFYGITRSLKYTIGSINKNIFDVLASNNIDYDVFVHCYRLSSYKNVRTRENTKDIDNEEYKLLNPTYSKQDIQDDIKAQLDLLSYRKHPDPWGTGYNSVDNFILGKYSKYKVCAMIGEHIDEYDYILYMRPDCMYLDKLDIQFFDLCDDKTIVIPNTYCFGKYKINDRFAITNKATYKIYGEIFTHLLDMSKNHKLHSETIIGIILCVYNKLNIHRVKFNFSRCRCNGKLVDTFNNAKQKNVRGKK